jgi:tripartite-type tricarboxylate transporter receptor subunit TctC
MHRLTATGTLAALIISTGFALSVYAQEFPSRPLRFIVPFSAGGTSDIVARLVGVTLGEDLGAQIVIDNRDGAGATIGAHIATQATPNGYTILIAHVGLAINETMYPKRDYEAAKDLTGISLIGLTDSALVVNNELPAKTVKEFIAMAKAQPGKLAYGSGGIGSASHLSVELLQSMARLSFNHVPYKGAGPAMNDVISGQLQFTMPTLPLAVTAAKAGRVRLIATTGDKRSSAMPDTPTVAEAGVPGYSYTTWYAIFAPAATPAPIIARLNLSVVKALGTAALREKLSAQGLEVESSTPEQLNNRLRRDIDKWKKIIKTAGIAGN